jgi:hypothetical protein
MGINNPVTWTRADARDFAELTLRFEQWKAQTELPVCEFVAGNWPFHKPNVENVAVLSKWLMTNADTIRDLLAPFDSGVRPAPDKPDQA